MPQWHGEQLEENAGKRRVLGDISGGGDIKIVKEILISILWLQLSGYQLSKQVSYNTSRWTKWNTSGKIPTILPETLLTSQARQHRPQDLQDHLGLHVLWLKQMARLTLGS